MGAINDVFIENKLSLKRFDEFLNYLINISPNKLQNKSILQDIGLIKEYAQIITEKESNLTIYYSNNHKIIKSIKYMNIIRENFLEWIKYLFDITKADSDSIQKLENKINQLKSITLTKEYFQNNIKKYIFNLISINKIINYGIPPNLRIFIWDLILAEKYNNHKIFNYEQELKEYRILLSNNKPNTQIEKDIHRTFIKEEEQTPNRIQILKNILNCVNNYNNSGYCQGMNYIIGFLLKVTNYNEVMTFYFFKLILKDIKGYFEEGLPLLNKNVIIFENYFSEFYPKIYKHFKKHEIINEFYITKWLQTLLTISLPFEELCIIWDILLIRGFDFIIFICLAFFDFISDNIIKIKESADIINYLEKAMNSEGESLIPVNIKFFEQIDDYIIPINEILEKAQELEKKTNKKNKNIYEIRKSDNQLLDMNFKNLKENKKILAQKNNDFSKSIKLELNRTSNNKNIHTLSNFPLNNSLNQNTINNNNLILQQKKMYIDKTIKERANYYSSKNLEAFNFNIKNEISPFQNQLNNNGYLNRNYIHPNLLYNRVNYGNKCLTYNPY